MAKESGKGLYKKRYATLKEHRAAVAAAKTNKGGKNVGPVAHGKTYADSLKVKPAEKKPAPKPKATPKASKPKAPKAKPTATTRPKQTVNGASLGSKITPEERKKREEAMKPSSVKAGETKKKVEVKKETPKRHRGGARSSNNTRGRARTTRGPKAGDTRRTRKGSSYVTQMYDGKKWVNGKVGGKG